MKTQNTFLKKIYTIGLGLAFTLISAGLAHADPDLTGSYRGKYKDERNARIDIVFRSLADSGREGSYLAVMLQNKPLKVQVYLVDRKEDGAYVMQPRQVTSDGEVVGAENIDPSLVLTVTGEHRDNLNFNITNAHSSNCNGFMGSMTFQGNDESDLEWLDATAGNFSLLGDKANIPNNMVDHETAISLALPGRYSGEYHMREKLPGVYTLNLISSTAEGDKRVQHPSNMVLFLRKPSLFGSDFFTLINPNDYQDVIKAIRRPWGQN